MTLAIDLGMPGGIKLEKAPISSVKRGAMFAEIFIPRFIRFGLCYCTTSEMFKGGARLRRPQLMV